MDIVPITEPLPMSEDSTVAEVVPAIGTAEVVESTVATRTVATDQAVAITRINPSTDDAPITDDDSEKDDPATDDDLIAKAPKDAIDLIKAALSNNEIVPIIELHVARYAACETKIDEQMPDVKGWLTKSATVPGSKRVLRVFPEFFQEVNDNFPGVLDAVAGRDPGCIWGIALLEVPFSINTIGGAERPKILYRMVHAGQPHAGIKSRRGKGSSPVFTQIDFQKHFRWTCREPSPFLSTTNNPNKACRIAELYELRGHHHVEIITFRTTGPGWDHNVQRMWHAQHVLHDLDLPEQSRPYFRDEYLIEDSIPEESIISRQIWDEDKEKMDPDGKIRRKAAAIERKRKNKAAADLRLRKKQKEAKTHSAETEAPKKSKRVKVGPKMGPIGGA